MTVVELISFKQKLVVLSEVFEVKYLKNVKSQLNLDGYYKLIRIPFISPEN